MGKNKNILQGDKVIWMVVLLLGVISLLAVYSATSSEAHVKIGAYNEKVLLKHAGTLLAGYVAMFIASRHNYRHFSRGIELIMLVGIVLLTFTLIFGSRINGANRTFMGFQTSEAVKIILIVYLAKYIVVLNNKIQNGEDYSFKEIFVPVVLPIFFAVGLIFPENLSTAAMLFVVSLVMLFIGQFKFKYILLIVAIAIAGASMYILSNKVVADYRQKRYAEVVELALQHPEDAKLQEKASKKPRVSRVETWKRRFGIGAEDELEEGQTEGKTVQAKQEKDKLYIDDHNAQKIYAKIAIARGGLVGKGSGKSTQRNFLPQPFSDCIYAIIIEEYGIIGGVFVMLLYIILLTRAVKIMKDRTLSFGALMAFGITFILFVQAMINMGVSTGFLPVTGQQLPFISRGGSAMLVTGWAFGMIISVTRDMNKDTEKTIETNEEINLVEEQNTTAE